MTAESQTLIGKLHKALAQVPYLPRALGLVWSAARCWTLAWGALLVVQGLLPVATVYLTRQLVDSLARAVSSGGDAQSLRATLLPLLLMIGVMLVARVLGSVSGWVRTAQAELVRDRVAELIQNKCLELDLAFYESPEYYDRLHRARSDASYRPLALLDSSGSLIQNGITLLAMAAVLLRFGLVLPIALLASALPAFYALLHQSQRERRWVLRTTEDQRRAWYYDWLLTSGGSAAELRLFRLGSYFQAAFRELRRRLRLERLQLARHQVLVGLGAGVAALLIPGMALAWMVWRALQGQVTLGDLALLYQAFNQGQGLMRSLLENLGQIYSNSLFLGDLFDFLALQPQVMDPAHPSPCPTTLREGIHFRGITFRYPGSERPALRDLTLFIPAGQIAAIVGANGAGKSTLIKLLCRLYDPDAGRIEIDEKDLRDLTLAELRELFAVLLQEPTHFYTSVAENIRLGNLGVAVELSEIKAAAQAAGADEVVARLPQGYDTPLGKWFSGGTDLSVGEWQRIALARAFLRRASIIILDEPTSAMDSWAEIEWLRRFSRLAAGRTVIIITHRFTTAMRADVIHVMEEGRIVESGSHQELLARGGRYAQSWKAQMSQ